MHIKILIILLSILLTQFTLTLDANITEAYVCNIPSSKMIIEVTKEGEEALYNFTVTNLHDMEIIGFYIDGTSLNRLTNRDITPIKFISPKGWIGKVYKEVSLDVYYFWQPDWDNCQWPDDIIQSGQTLSHKPT